MTVNRREESVYYSRVKSMMLKHSFSILPLLTATRDRLEARPSKFQPNDVSPRELSHRSVGSFG